MALLISGCSLHRKDERLHSTLWVQTSAEYGITTTQIYRLADAQLGQALADPDWSAVGPSGEDGRPAAIIVDVDETILDNAGHAARSILARESFSQEMWYSWVREAAAPAVPGAVQFLQQVDARGVTVFYVSNRHHVLEEPTRRNLLALGFPVRSDIDVVLLREEEPGWGRDKRPRRERVARDFRVLQVIGDDLQDFVQMPEGLDHEQRIALANESADRWGTSWFILPNPIYGGWEQALMQGEHSRFLTPLDRKYRELETQ